MSARLSLRSGLVCSLLLAACADETPVDSAGDQSDTPSPDAVDAVDVPDDTGSGSSACEPEGDTTPLRPNANPTEYVALTVQFPVTSAELRTVLDPIFGLGDTAFHQNFVVQDGILLSAATDPRTPEQVVIQVDMEVTTDEAPLRRLVTRVPASVEYGRIFVDAVEAAVTTAETTAARNDETSPFRIEYRTRSANGGFLTIALDSTGTTHNIVVSSRSPRTSLQTSNHNGPAESGTPFESIYGLVFFDMSRDNFDFFVDRAYGISEGAAQNFKDFYLIPHNWLRLTVTPELDDNRVDVAFEVVNNAGDRIPIARAPASLLAGEQFKQTVFRLMDTMIASEADEPGSSTPFETPFYYDDPQGGGVVEVIVRGEGGLFKVAYAVESPANELVDTDFVPWQGIVVVPDDWDAVDPTCAEIGSVEAAQGFFNITFEASSTIRDSPPTDGELVGPVWGSVFRAEDVIITGPLEGTEAVASFRYDELDLRDGPDGVYRIDTPLQAGDYQILGFMDVDGNADPENPDPDRGDPVMIPIGGFALRCAEEPITVEFAILRP
jgi:hypothetical protein